MLKRVVWNFWVVCLCLPVIGCAFGIPCHCGGLGRQMAQTSIILAGHSEAEVDATPSLPALVAPRTGEDISSSEPVLMPSLESGTLPVGPILPPTAEEAELATQSISAVYERGLDASTCQCMAAAASFLGNMIEQEQKEFDLRIQPVRKRQKRLAELGRTLLWYSALLERNKSAANALVVYYRLAEAQARLEILQASTQAVDEAIAKTQDLIRRGLRSPLDGEALKRQRLELEQNRVRLQRGIRQSNRALRRLLGYGAHDPDWDFHAADDWQKTPAVVSESDALQTGLTHHPQLELLRTVNEQLDASTLPVAREVLRSVSSLLTTRPQRHGLGFLEPLFAWADGAELVVTAEHLQQLLHEREQAIVAEIQEALDDLRAQANRLKLAKQTLESQTMSLKAVEEQGAKGIEGFVKIINARLAWLAAREDVTRAAIAQQLAVVKLKEAQGILALQCGLADCPASLAESP
ncbi:MAG: hypothetical protein KatS3mg105_0065 [Gemmatales bacterium]|nr:MAG: hypothetical protein KatS3mg105_0065 [Gemmatales bacterium]